MRVTKKVRNLTQEKSEGEKNPGNVIYFKLLFGHHSYLDCEGVVYKLSLQD